MKDETQPKPIAKPKIEEKKAPPAKPAPPKAGGKPAAGAAGGDEETGGGMSKDEAEAKVIETFPPEVVACFEDTKKWNEKQEGYKAIA